MSLSEPEATAGPASALAVPPALEPGPDAPGPYPHFTVTALDHPLYSHYLIDPACRVIEPFSFALSEMVRGRPRQTVSDYIGAFRRCLDRWAGTCPTRVDRLLTNADEARLAVCELVRSNGCALRRSRLNDGSWTVHAAKTQAPGSDRRAAGAAGSSRASAQQIYLALLTLKHCYDALMAWGRWPHANPMLVDDVAIHRRMAETMPAPPWASPFARYAGLQFVVVGMHEHPVDLSLTVYTPTILEAARAWPAGLAEVTWLLANCGCRISEALALTLADWAKYDFGGEIDAPNKGSRGERCKVLFLTQAAEARLIAYLEGPRAEASGMTLRAARRLVRRHGVQALADTPLFLSPHGTAISYAVYHRHYFRTALDALGLASVTPHRLRHEHALRALLTIIRTARDPADESRMVEEYAQVLGWKSGARMFHYYAPQIRFYRSRAAVDMQDAAGAAPDGQVIAILPRPTPHDPHLEAFYAGFERCAPAPGDT